MPSIPDWMVVGAVRDAIGRSGPRVGVVCDWLVRAWPRLPDGVRSTIRRDIDAAFVSDELDRQDGRVLPYLGSRDDRAHWQRVRALWEGK